MSVDDWRFDAACRYVDLAIFFPTREKGGQTTADAKEICRGCPVSGECLTYAIDNRIKFGVWGAMTEQNRRKEVRRRKKVAA